MHQITHRLVRAIAPFSMLGLLASCAAPLTTEATQVRQIQPPEASSACKFLGVMEVSGGLVYSSVAEGKRDMLAKIRNETARRGGNAYVLTTLVADHGFSLPFAQGDAYRCP